VEDTAPLLNSDRAVDPGSSAARSSNLEVRWSASDTRFLALLFALALLPRLYVAIAWAREPVWDGHYYHFGATRIAQGLGYSEDVNIAGQLVWKPWCHYPVGYSGLVGMVYKVFGTGLWVAPVLNALIGALTAAVVFALARYCLGPWRARIAGLLCAFHPGLVLYTALVMTERS
jgi:4-amino-4-deoxy-L-arabinose transferase-like glycosyltransferase